MVTPKIWVNILDILWPVGSLYYCLSDTANTPGVVLGGTWIQKSETLTVGTTTYTSWVRIA